MSICKFKFFRGLYPRTPVNRGRKGKGRGGKGEGRGRRRVGDEGYRTGRRGGDGIRKKGKGKGREGGKHTPVFSNTPPPPKFELSRNKPIAALLGAKILITRS
jgi:hypothetical protein